MPREARRAACLVQSERRLGQGSSEAGCRPKVLLEVPAGSPEELLTTCRTAGRCVLMPGLSPVLEGSPNTKFSEKSITSAEGASATTPRPDGATSDTSSAVETAQKPHAVWKQRLTSVLMPLEQPGLRSSEPLVSAATPRSAQFHAAHHAVNARVVLPRGFGVQEGTAAPALATSHPDSVAESFLNVGNVVVRCQDTSRTRVQVVKPLVGDLSVAKVLNPGDLRPSSFGVERVPQAPETRPISES